MKKETHKMNKTCCCTGWTGLLTLLLGMMLIAPLPSFAARPLITDDSGTVGKGKFQAELGVEWSTWKDTEDGVRVKETRTEASGVFTYGVSDCLDVVVGVPHDWAKVRENGTTVFRENGFADLSLETKWRFFDKDGLGLALKPGITFPTGDYKKDFGAGRVTYGLTFVATKDVGPFGFNFNGGYTRNENKLGERKDVWSASFAPTYEVKEGFYIVGDIGIERNADPITETAPAFALVGVSYAVTDNVVLDAGIKFGLNKQEVDRAVTAGVTLNF
jgi:hypothetical protein